MILPQDTDLRIYVAQGPAVRKEQQFSGECNSHCNDRGQMKGLCTGPHRGSAMRKFQDRKNDKYEGYGRHEEAEHDITSRLDPGFSRGEAPRVNLFDGAMACD